MADMTGKRVLITGAARGIGFATAQRFAAAEAELIITDMNEDALQEAARRLREQGAVVHPRICDVSSRPAVEELACWVLSDLGGLDILINNAGIGHHGELAEISEQEFRKLMEVNFWGALYHVYAFLPYMERRRSGQIVNVSSGQAFFKLPTWGAYTATKLALAGFSEILHYELRKKNIFVTTVYPFMVNTGFYADLEGETLAGRLSMKLMPYYSMRPETVGKIIYQATKKRKRVEMVSMINTVGRQLVTGVPGVRSVVSFASNFLLAKSERLVQRQRRQQQGGGESDPCKARREAA